MPIDFSLQLSDALESSSSLSYFATKAVVVMVTSKNFETNEGRMKNLF